MAPYFRFNIPCATTSTTTTTTTLDLVTINIYAKQISPTYTLDFHYSIDGGSNWNFVGASFNSATCDFITSLSVARFSSLMLRMGSTSNINTVYRSNQDSTDCPSYNDATAQCEWTVSTTTNRSLYYTANVENSSVCPGDPTTTTTTTTTTTSTTTTTTTAAPTTTTTTSTTTTTTTAAPTTTSTTTTTTTILEYAVGVYGKLTSAVETPIKFQYSSDSGANWIDAGDYFDSTTCALRGSFNVPSGTSVLLRATDGANTYYHARANNSTTCPGAPYGVCESLSGNITANRDVAITVDMFTVCDITTTTTTTTLPP